MRYAIGGEQGRMGQAIKQIAVQYPHLQYAGSVFNNNHEWDESVADKTDVILDFSSPQATQIILKNATCPVLVGTTGHTHPLSSNHPIPLLIAPNTSTGICLLKQALKLIAPHVTHCKIDIIDHHHERKKDAPSGTAISLSETFQALTENRQNINMYSLRSGDACGEHEVRIQLEGEQLKFTHTTWSRDVFAHGAIQAAQWLVNQSSGVYSMENVFANSSAIA